MCALPDDGILLFTVVDHVYVCGVETELQFISGLVSVVLCVFGDCPWQR
jgi:hypothetical protein